MGEDITIDNGKHRLNCRSSAIIIHNNKILFHKNINEDYYALLGGRVQFGESSEDAIIREVKEELGKEIKTIGYVATIENFFNLRSKDYHEILFVHLAEFVNKEDQMIETTIKSVEEGKDYLTYEWVDIKDINNTNIKPNVIKDILVNKQFPTHVINNEI